MKKTILALGSALLLLTNTLHAQIEDISFGLKGGGSFFLPTMDTAKRNDNKEYEGNWKMFVTLGPFFKFMPFANMSIGGEIVYTKMGVELTEKKQSGSNSDNNKSEDGYCLDIHALDLTVPIAWLPMDEEGGLSLFAGPAVYFVLATKEKPIGDKDSKDADKGLVNPVNAGITCGLEYEIPESGVSVGSQGKFFFLDTFRDDEKAKAFKKDFGKKEEDKSYTCGTQFFICVNIPKLFDL